MLGVPIRMSEAFKKKTCFQSIQYSHQQNHTDSIASLLKQELSFNRTSWVLLAMFLVTLSAIILIRWDLFMDYYNAVGIDWLLIGIFTVMGTILIAGANLKKDVYIIICATFGGLFIEGWGTQTEMWQYYTELPPYNDPSRPPWWIIPAWPIASLTINRLYIFLDILIKNIDSKIFNWLYWPIFLAFYCTFFDFYKHAVHLPLTWVVIALSFYLFIKHFDTRKGVMIFIAGAVLGYFLEYWGTSRHCWVYYNREVPPWEAVFAHGVASVVFARMALRMERYWPPMREFIRTTATGKERVS
jgi:hypothetical protein